MMESMRATGDVDFHSTAGFTPISWYAMDAMRYMHEWGVGRDKLASVAVKNRAHASLNPLAQFRKPISIDDVLAQRPIVEPLGLFEVPHVAMAPHVSFSHRKNPRKASTSLMCCFEGAAFTMKGCIRLTISRAT